MTARCDESMGVRMLVQIEVTSEDAPLSQSGLAQALLKISLLREIYLTRVRRHAAAGPAARLDQAASTQGCRCDAAHHFLRASKTRKARRGCVSGGLPAVGSSRGGKALPLPRSQRLQRRRCCAPQRTPAARRGVSQGPRAGARSHAPPCASIEVAAASVTASTRAPNGTAPGAPCAAGGINGRTGVSRKGIRRRSAAAQRTRPRLHNRPGACCGGLDDERRRRRASGSQVRERAAHRGRSPGTAALRGGEGCRH